MLVAVHIAREQKEDLRIKSLLQHQRAIVAPCPPNSRSNLTIDQVRLLVPNFCRNPGLNSAVVPNLSSLFRDVYLPGSSRFSSQALAAIKWYWSRLKWAQQVDPLDSGATWLELYLDATHTIST